MKKKIFIITFAVCLLVLSIAGSSLAYFTDTDAKSNVFVSGNVAIELDYSEDDVKVFPGQTYTLPATIKNVGSEDAYVGLIIEVDPGTFDSQTDIDDLFTIENATDVKYTKTTSKYVIYAVIGAPLASGSDSKVTVNVKVNIPAKWDHAEVTTFKANTVNVTAYATQTVGFTGAAQALTSAFTAWADYN